LLHLFLPLYHDPFALLRPLTSWPRLLNVLQPRSAYFFPVKVASTLLTVNDLT